MNAGISRLINGLLGGATALSLLAGAAAQAQTADKFPAKPVRIMYPFAAGGGMEVVLRVMAEDMQKSMGQPVIVDNRTGAGGSIAANAAATATPDGYTLFVGPIGISAITPHLRKLPYDARGDLVAVAKLSEFSSAYVVSNELPVKTLAEFIAYAKANPGKVTYATSGVGSQGHLGGEMLQKAWGIKMTHVPYKGSAGVVNAMLAGDIDLTFDSISTSMPHIRSGRMHALAVTSPQRSALAPEVPTVQEQGIAGFDVTGWYALIAPAGTPPEITQRLSREIAAALRQPQLQSQLAAGGYEPVGSTPEALQAHIEREITRWAAVVKSTGARVD